MAENKIIYQIALRTFTPEGTLAAATKLLGHVASLGVDIVYVCPFYVQENDPDKNTWSKRQLKSNTDNPKNPYKIADYFNVDEEYGTNEDLKRFVDQAHRLGLLVMFDLVYLHCARHAVFFDEHPDFVERNEDGTVKVPDRWPFARLNFESRELRKYLISNMEMLMTEYKADAFRCDVGDAVPLDFWQEAFDYLKKIKPDLITLNEGEKPEYIQGVFDMGYAFGWNSLVIKIFTGEENADQLRSYYVREQEMYGDNIKKLIRTIETHDTASDCEIRNEISMTSRGVEAALVITNTFGGVPFLWNGYELCDDAENCMFSNRFFGKRSAMDWSKAFTANGIRRRAFIDDIYKLYHSNEAIRGAELEWVDNDMPEDVISYIKKSSDSTVLVAVNSKNKKISAVLSQSLDKGKTLMNSQAAVDGSKISLGPYGYLIMSI